MVSQFKAICTWWKIGTARHVEFVVSTVFRLGIHIVVCHCRHSFNHHVVRSHAAPIGGAVNRPALLTETVQWVLENPTNLPIAHRWCKVLILPQCATNMERCNTSTACRANRKLSVRRCVKWNQNQEPGLQATTNGCPERSVPEQRNSHHHRVVRPQRLLPEPVHHGPAP